MREVIKERILVIMAIILFACVPMVQLVTASDSLQATGIDSNDGEIARGWNLSQLNGRFDLPAKKPFDQVPTQWKNTRPSAGKPQRTLPNPTIPLFNLSPLFPEQPEVPDTTNSPVYISDLNLISEYVKITNQGKETVIMTGWKIANREGTSITFIDFPEEDGSFYTFKLPPHRTVTVYSGREGNPGGYTFYWPDELWNDSGDTAYLYNPDGELVSSFSR
ncbi:MAG: lamin tail domain-containing protein [Methanolinea sp.]|nr:lamin tail domain-containing protein [Methanolinea sp.]